MKTFPGLLAVVLLSGLLCLVPSGRGICGPAFPLDREAVFCMYYKMSRGCLDDQDIEDFCFSSGKPTFTPYKPAEMFTNNSLRRLRSGFLHKIREYGETSVFKWSFMATIMPVISGMKGRKFHLNKTGMPEPTSFISSEISRNGWMWIKKILNSLDGGTQIPREKTSLKIDLYLRPEEIAHRFQKRNIARQNVRLPLSSVVFQPVRMELFRPGHPHKTLLSYDIPCRKKLNSGAIE